MSDLTDPATMFMRTFRDIACDGPPDDTLEARLWMTDLTFKWQELDPPTQAAILDELAEWPARLLSVCVLAVERMDALDPCEDEEVEE